MRRKSDIKERLYCLLQRIGVVVVFQWRIKAVHLQYLYTLLCDKHNDSGRRREVNSKYFVMKGFSIFADRPQ